MHLQTWLPDRPRDPPPPRFCCGPHCPYEQLVQLSGLLPHHAEATIANIGGTVRGTGTFLASITWRAAAATVGINLIQGCGNWGLGREWSSKGEVKGGNSREGTLGKLAGKQGKGLAFMQGTCTSKWDDQPVPAKVDKPGIATCLAGSCHMAMG